jgi:hypothetical protein
MTSYKQIENPFFHDNISKGEISYHNNYPYIKFINKTLINGIINKQESTSYIEAERYSIIHPEIIGFLFKYADTITDISNTTIGDVTYYDAVSTLSNTDSQLTDISLSGYKYELLLKKEQEGIIDTFWFSTYEDDYQGELDYVNLKISQTDLVAIKQKIENLNENLKNIILPEEAIPETIIENDIIKQNNNLTNYGVEFYFYVWEKMNAPWFTNYGTIVNIEPSIINIADGNGEINLAGGNENFINAVGLGKENDREGKRLYTLNFTNDETPDSSSNYVTIYRITPKENQLFPDNIEINILSPKFSRFYFIWTYRYINCGTMSFFDNGNTTSDAYNTITERKILLEGVPPLFTPGVILNQEGFMNAIPWRWKNLDFSWGENINNFNIVDVDRLYKAKHKLLVEYVNQSVNITLPNEAIMDISKNFINRYRPDRHPPKYQTFEGSIYYHQYENKEITRLWYNIYIFTNTNEHDVILLDNTTTTIPILYNIEQNTGDEQIEIHCNLISEYDDEILVGKRRANLRIYLKDLSENKITEFVKGYKYIIKTSDDVFLNDNIRISITENGIHNNGYEYKHGITYSGVQGTYNGLLTIDVKYDYSNTIYFYLENESSIKELPEINIKKNEITRDYNNANIPYNDTFKKISSNDTKYIINNELYIEKFENANIDYDGVLFQDRGILANKKVDESGNLILDESGNEIRIDALIRNDISNADTKLLNENQWVAYEQFLINNNLDESGNVQIMRSYVDELIQPTNDYIKYPKHLHILSVPGDSGWSVSFKKYNALPKDISMNYPISSNEYYVRWNYSYRRYNYDKTDYTEPSKVYLEDISYNVGISPFAYFDFRDFGGIYETKPPTMTYLPKEYIDSSGVVHYYNNLNISINPDELDFLGYNIKFNTTLDCNIHIQIYVMKPKNRTDRNQLNPLIDLSSTRLDGKKYQRDANGDIIFDSSGNEVLENETDLNYIYDLSFNLQAQVGKIFPDTLSIDISENGVKETTLIPGRYIAIWSYTVTHNNPNPPFIYPLQPGKRYSITVKGSSVDEIYDASAAFIDIQYNDFLYGNEAPFFQIPKDLSRMTLGLTKEDMENILKMKEMFFESWGENTEITFKFFLWSPNYEHTQLLSGNRRWELPDKFQGEDDPRIKEVPTQYKDGTGIFDLSKCYLGNDNSDTLGHVYNWGFGGEPGIQYRKLTYFDISNNKVFNKGQFIDIDTNDSYIEISNNYWTDISASDYIIDFYCDFTGGSNDTDLSMNTANWGFGNVKTAEDILSYDDGIFHMGINGNGIDTLNIDVGNSNGLPFQQKGFIYKPPYSSSNEEFIYKYRFNEQKIYKIRYKFQEVNIYGEDTPRQDVTIYVDDELIYDIPGGGVKLSELTYLGVEYDTSSNPIKSRPYRIEVWYKDTISTKTKLKDLSNTTIIENVLVPQDFDENDTETKFYESQKYETNGLYIPYISRWEYEIYDPSSNIIVKSSILESQYENLITRKADWKIVQTPDGGETFERSSQYPFKNKYKYAVLYSTPEDFIPPEPMYPVKELDVSYDSRNRDIVVTFDRNKIVYPLMYNLMNYWKANRSKTIVNYIIYVWYPNSNTLPNDYTSPVDISNINLWENNVYDASYVVQSSSPYVMTNILPSIPHNIFTIEEQDLIFGKWVLAWDYNVNNNDYMDFKSRPDYGFFDISAVEINIPPILYNPNELNIEYIDDISDNQKIKLKIKNEEMMDLSKNISYQLKGLQDVTGIEITYYLWSPNKEKTFDISGWKLPEDYYGLSDQRIHAFPVEYIEKETSITKSYVEHININTNEIFDKYYIENSGSGNYLINKIKNGTITLYRNKKYHFEVNAIGHPFIIKTNMSIGTDNSYNTGIINNGTDNGTIEIEIVGAINKLYYNCEHHSTMKGVINIIDEGEDLGYKKSKAFSKSIIITDLSKIMDASCIYFDHTELLSDGDGNVPYTSEYIKNDKGIPYICRWSYEILRNNLPNYYSDIGDDAYHRNYEWNVVNNKIEKYGTIIRYKYNNLFTYKPVDEPEIIIIKENKDCSCPQNQEKITKTQETINMALRKRTMLENFRNAKRLRGKKLSEDKRVTDHIKKTGNSNVIVKMDTLKICDDDSLHVAYVQKFRRKIGQIDAEK